MVRRVLLVEDDPAARLLIERILLRIDPALEIICVATAEVAYRTLRYAILDKRPFDVVISDLNLPGSSGLVLHDIARMRHPDLGFLMVSEVNPEVWFSFSSKLSESPDFLHKPLSESQLKTYWRERFGSDGFSSG